MKVHYIYQPSIRDFVISSIVWFLVAIGLMAMAEESTGASRIGFYAASAAFWFLLLLTIINLFRWLANFANVFLWWRKE